MNDCLFCKIIRGEIPSTKVYEDEYVYAFNDIEPQAPHHIIIVPKEHIESANAINDKNSVYISKIFEIIPKIAKDLGFAEDGYCLLIIWVKKGGKIVLNFNFHLTGGWNFGWPAG